MVVRNRYQINALLKRFGTAEITILSIRLPRASAPIRDSPGFDGNRTVDDGIDSTLKNTTARRRERWPISTHEGNELKHNLTIGVLTLVAALAAAPAMAQTAANHSTTTAPATGYVGNTGNTGPNDRNRDDSNGRRPCQQSHRLGGLQQP
jgi:hypothetical protein